MRNTNNVGRRPVRLDKRERELLEIKIHDLEYKRQFFTETLSAECPDDECRAGTREDIALFSAELAECRERLHAATEMARRESRERVAKAHADGIASEQARRANLLRTLDDYKCALKEAVESARCHWTMDCKYVRPITLKIARIEGQLGLTSSLAPLLSEEIL